jgi:hypothetical protein
MYLTKSNPTLTTNGKIADDCEIKNGVFYFKNHKYENGKWYFFGIDERWYYLGLGANPVLELAEVDNDELALQVFDKVESEV